MAVAHSAAHAEGLMRGVCEALSTALARQHPLFHTDAAGVGLIVAVQTHTVQPMQDVSPADPTSGR